MLDRAGPDRVLEERPYCEDEVAVAVPEGHPWAAAEVEVEDFVATRMVMRDPGANSRRVVEARGHRRVAHKQSFGGTKANCP